jgi:hypothetical protein
MNNENSHNEMPVLRVVFNEKHVPSLWRSNSNGHPYEILARGQIPEIQDKDAGGKKQWKR